MLKQGDKLSERYTVERILGQGGMGAVYLASMDALGGKRVAIKEMEHQGSKSDDRESALTQFRTEATFLAHLEHPNLVQVTDFFVQSDKYYLVMAYVPGQTLQQRLAQNGKPFRWSEIADWAESLCAVIGYLHAQDPPILFRDLKPSNIMIEDSGRLKLIDFGIARSGQAGSKTSTFLQGTGTSGFSPIEQYGGSGTTDERSDIYSLGATLYTLLTGVVPPDAVARISHGEQLAPLSAEDTTHGAQLDRILARAMAQKAGDRYPSVSELARELKSVTRADADDGGPTEDLRKATLGGVQATTGSLAPASRSITVEMYPTGTPASRPSSNWVAVGSLASAACLAALLLSSKWGMSGSATVSPSPPFAPVVQSSNLRPAPSLEQEAAAVPSPASPSTAKEGDGGASMDRPPVPQRSKPAATQPDPVAPKAATVTTARPAVAAPKIGSEADSYPKAAPRAEATPEPDMTTWESEPPRGRPGGPPPPPPGAPTPVQGPDGRWLPPPRPEDRRPADGEPQGASFEGRTGERPTR